MGRLKVIQVILYILLRKTKDVSMAFYYIEDGAKKSVISYCEAASFALNNSQFTNDCACVLESSFVPEN